MHPYIARALACALVLLNPVPVRADDLPLTKLKIEAIDWLSFGIASLQADLRLRQLELCANANCKSQEVEISVSYLAAKPESLTTLQWPADGAIVIGFETKRVGSDSSMATESGCRTSLKIRMRGQDSRTSWMSYARFFIPREKWIGLARDSKEPAAIERVTEISRRMILVATESHEWNRPNGVPDRAVWITCAAQLIDLQEESDDKIVIISKGQWA